MSLLRSIHPSTLIIVLGAIPLVAILFTACTVSDEEMRDNARERAREDMVTVKPRPGVECYILRGSTSSNPRSMSCVAVQEAR